MSFAQLPPDLLPDSVGLFDLLKKGGVVAWILLGTSVVASGVMLERWIYYHRRRLALPIFLDGVCNLLRGHRYLEALERCDEVAGPVRAVLQTAIQRRYLPASELREVVREIAQLQVPSLEANLSLLATLGAIAPLFGLLGTVLGMIEAFLKINLSGGAAPVGDLANGVWTALITTAAGLMVSIPCQLAYNFFVSCVQQSLHDMERCGIEVIHLLTDPAHRAQVPTEAKDLVEKTEVAPAPVSSQSHSG